MRHGSGIIMDTTLCTLILPYQKCILCNYIHQTIDQGPSSCSIGSDLNLFFVFAGCLKLSTLHTPPGLEQEKHTQLHRPAFVLLIAPPEAFVLFGSRLLSAEKYSYIVFVII